MSGRVAWLERNDFTDYFSLSIIWSTATVEETGFFERSIPCYYIESVTLSDIAPYKATNVRI
jgi:hypothetical protein